MKNLFTIFLLGIAGCSYIGADMFDSVTSVRINVGIGYTRQDFISKKDRRVNEYEYKAQAIGDVSVDSLIPILKKGKNETEGLWGIYMDGPANDTYFELTHSDGTKQILYFTSDCIFDYAYLYDNPVNFRTIRDICDEKQNELKRISFEKDEQIALYELITKHRINGLKLNSGLISPQQFNKN